LVNGISSVYYCPDGIFTKDSNGNTIAAGIGIGINDTQIEGLWTQIGTLYTFPGKPLAAIYQPGSLVAFADMAQLDITSDPTMNNTALCTYCDPANPTGPGCGPFNFQTDKWKYTTEEPGWNIGVPGTGDGDFCPTRSRVMAFRHSNHTNANFADGHAKALPGSSINAQVGSQADLYHNHQ
jgi:prepilin-type processing-associated H-X9-DG protein